MIKAWQKYFGAAAVICSFIPANNGRIATVKCRSLADRVLKMHDVRPI